MNTWLGRVEGRGGGKVSHRVSSVHLAVCFQMLPAYQAQGGGELILHSDD